MPRPKLTHFDEAGAAHMVDVGAKPETERVAIASGRVEMAAATVQAIRALRERATDVLSLQEIHQMSAVSPP